MYKHMDAQQIFRDVWGTRDRIAQAWPTPNTSDSYWFAATEGGEATLDLMLLAVLTREPGQAYSMAHTAATQAIDAELRSKNFARNNQDKVRNVADEIADTAMMLATGLGPVWNEHWSSLVQDRFPVPYIVDVATLSFLASAAAMLAQPTRNFGLCVVWIAAHDTLHYNESVTIMSPHTAAVEGMRVAAKLVGEDRLASLVGERLARIESKARARMQR